MVGQLIQNLVCIFPNGYTRTDNTKHCLDTSKRWINGPSKTIWIDLNRSTQLATNTVQMVSPCVYKTNGHFWKWNFVIVSNSLISRRVSTWSYVWFKYVSTLWCLHIHIYVWIKDKHSVSKHAYSLKQWSQHDQWFLPFKRTAGWLKTPHTVLYMWFLVWTSSVHALEMCAMQ